MRNRLVLTVLFTAAVGALAACDPATGGGSAAKTPSAAPASSTAPSAPATPTPSASPDGKVAADVRATVPDFVGMGLQAAQDKAQETGFYGLTSHDSLGRDRMQAFDRNWKVCSQNVKAGTSASTGTTLDFGSVKLDETCPDKEQAAPTAAAWQDARLPRQVREGGPRRPRQRHVDHGERRLGGGPLGADGEQLEGLRPESGRRDRAQGAAGDLHGGQVRRELHLSRTGDESAPHRHR